MEAHELRIGNKVFNPYHNKVYTVDGFKTPRAPGLERRVYVSTQEMTEHSVLISVLEPVQLNSDWLINAGARPVEAGDEKQWTLGKLRVRQRDGAYAVSPAEGVWLPVDAVHDLQNMYYYFHNKSELDLIRFL